MVQDRAVFTMAYQ